MTNKYKYFVANWKMFGDIKTINSINKVIKISKSRKFNKAKIIYCPPYTLINNFVQKLKKTKIYVGAQNCHHSPSNGPFTGFINSKMIKNLGCKYVIIGHSENRIDGDTDLTINKKIKSSLENNLNVLFCIGETIKEKKRGKTFSVLKKQIRESIDKKFNLKNIIIAYEPVWSIGSGKIPTNIELKKTFKFIKYNIKKILKINRNPIVLYGGSVKPENISKFSPILDIDGFLVGGASQSSKKFIDIIKNYYK